ncbi:hypothetical protein BLNAU_11817 [Blattamonas nauphoetae]|uniref:Uncharacterized protein n=1 Tax=Blattamonas nauphoetae TaxID=2049346 RepID=A0ABQ9XP79_9EUKA|nr:hypothetical protein BLNAU_14316 [Blattamonas nauphoetae]KAK2953192.1 hypothetical protein BLNAU_11817 [Blattamonas nauphoetae]
MPSPSLKSNIDATVYNFRASSSSSTKAFSIVPAQQAISYADAMETVAFDCRFDFEADHVNASRGVVYFPNAAAITSVSLVATPSPTSFWLKVVGENFEAGDRFRMSIVESAESNAAFVFEVIVEMSGSEDGQSAPFEVGRPSTLAFGRNYSVANHTLVSQEEFLVLTSETFTTPSKPAQMEIFVDGKTGVDGAGCGGVSAPCRTLDKALSHVESTVIETVKVSVANVVTLSTSHILPADIVMVVDQNGETGSIWVPSDASTASPLPTTSNSESVDEMGVCEWETGLVKVSGESIVVIGSNLSRIHQGVFFMANSTLTLLNSHLLSNWAGLDKFPSLERNVRCVKEGRIDVVSDEDANKQASLRWISSDGCSVVIGKEESKSPFVMPTLNVRSSGGEQKRIGDAVKVRIVGEQLIPCAHVETCTDTLIVLNVTLDEISLEASNEWEGRLIFGSSLVTESFVVKQSVREVRS